MAQDWVQEEREKMEGRMETHMRSWKAGREEACGRITGSDNELESRRAY